MVVLITTILIKSETVVKQVVCRLWHAEISPSPWPKRPPPRYKTGRHKTNATLVLPLVIGAVPHTGEADPMPTLGEKYLAIIDCDARMAEARRIGQIAPLDPPLHLRN
jgi:hypothetical protein